MQESEISKGKYFLPSSPHRWRDAGQVEASPWNNHPLIALRRSRAAMGHQSIEMSGVAFSEWRCEGLELLRDLLKRLR